MITKKEAMKRVNELVKLERSLCLEAYKLGVEVGYRDCVEDANKMLSPLDKKRIEKVMKMKEAEA